MDETLTEKEQIEEIRAWWKENGAYVIAGLVIGIGGILGFNQWRSSQLNTQLEASALYESLVDEVADNRLDPAQAIATDIYSNYAETIYADEARLAMARIFMDQGRDQDAATALQELVTDGGHKEIQFIGRLRLAKILLYQNKPEEVLTLLDGQDGSAFAPRYNEVRGDANFDLRRYQEAEAAYQAAMADPRATQLLDTALVQMKINDLPEFLPQTADAENPAATATTEASAETASSVDEETGE